MKITTKQYAQSFHDVVSQAADSDIDLIIKNFIKILINNNDLNRAEKIVMDFEEVWNKEKGVVEGELISARELNAGIIALLHRQIAKLLNVKEVILKTTVDEG